MEHPMRNNILAVAAIAAAISAPIAVRAQTVGVAPGASVVVEEAPVLPAEQYPAFREYVVRERIPDYAIPGRVVVGTVLPETGVTFYDVPSTIAATPYRYTIVNGSTVLVEPRTRRIVQVID
jgi:non-ribosomal peptide synthetase component E (peptide arylation enzyme)